METNQLSEQQKQELTDKFVEKQKQLGLNMAVMWYMVDALQFFKNKKEQDVSLMALEIAVVGTQGINVGVQDYTLATIPDKVFTGFHLLAYYYVSVALSLPELLPPLKIPYDKEFAIANQFLAVLPKNQSH